MLRFLQQQGFTLVRIRGSHHFFEGQGYRTSVPMYGN